MGIWRSRWVSEASSGYLEVQEASCGYLRCRFWRCRRQAVEDIWRCRRQAVDIWRCMRHFCWCGGTIGMQADCCIWRCAVGIKMWVSGAPGGKLKLTGSRANIYSISRPFLVSFLMHSCFHRHPVDTGGKHYTYGKKDLSNLKSDGQMSRK